MTTTVSETWIPRGIGSEWNLPCFVTGTPSAGEDDLKPNIAGFVKSREAGERVVEIFGGFARLDYRTREPNWIQVKVGATDENAGALKKLMQMVVEAGNIVTPEMVAAARADFLKPTVQPL